MNDTQKVHNYIYLKSLTPKIYFTVIKMFNVKKGFDANQSNVFSHNFTQIKFVLFNNNKKLLL